MAHLNEYLASLDTDITGHEAMLEAFQSAVDTRKKGIVGTHVRRRGSRTLGSPSWYNPHTKHGCQDQIPVAHHTSTRDKPHHPSTVTKLLSFGYDVMWDRVASLRKRAFIGQWHFDRERDRDIQNWVKTEWCRILGYPPKVCRLLNNWYSFHFLTMEDTARIVKIPWARGIFFLSLHT